MSKNTKSRRSKTPRTQKKELSRKEISITREAIYIINRAQSYNSRVVSLGSLIFFSTKTGDAWMLDCEDGLALCLAKGGDEQPFRIIETPEKFAIEWNANYRIDGDKFIVTQQSGQIKTILGYPTTEILKTIGRIL